jgi:stringent starvation protein B
MTRLLPKRPFLLRAMHQWITECGNTPHVIVDAAHEGAEVPRGYVKDGKIVLNLSEGATQRLRLGNEEVEFDARFAGVVHHVRFPVGSVLGIYARETGEGMVFSEQDLGPQPPTRPTPAEEGSPSRRPQLKVVK